MINDFLVNDKNKLNSVIYKMMDKRSKSLLIFFFFLLKQFKFRMKQLFCNMQYFAIYYNYKLQNCEMLFSLIVK